MKRTIQFVAALLVSLLLAAPASSGEIKIIDYNVWYGIDGRGTIKMGEYETPEARAERYSGLVAGLKALDPDIVGIQEANKVRPYSKRLARDTDRDAVWKVGNSGIKIFGLGFPVNYTAGLAVFARKGNSLELLSSKRLSGGGIQREWFSAHLEGVRYAMAAMVRIDNKPLIIFNLHTHFSLVPGEATTVLIDKAIARGEIPDKSRGDIVREIEEGSRITENDILALCAYIKETVRKYDHPYIIMGDLNRTPETEAIRRLIAELGLIDAWAVKNPGGAGYTWDPTVNTNTRYDGSPFYADGKTPRRGVAALEAEFDRTVPRRIDFILLSKHFRPESVKSARLVFNEPVNGRFVSDHIALEVVLKGMP